MKKVNKDKEFGIKEKLITEFNISKEVAEKLVVDYGADIVDIITDKPYILSRYLMPLEDVKQIIEKCSADKNEDYKNRNIVAAAIIYIIESMVKFEGQVFCYKSELEDKIKDLDEVVDKTKLGEALELLENDNKIIRDKNKERRECIYLSELYKEEVELAKLITHFAEANKNYCCDITKIAEFMESYKPECNELNKAQNEALRMALISRISIITGVAGSGKTTAIKAVVEGFKYLNQGNVQLVSFTGRAVERMTSVTGIQGSTIHRLLGIGIDGTNNVSSVNADVLIVDEAGMIGIELFKMLLDSVKDNKNIKIVIVGDEFQLQSIAPGSVLKDLIKSGLVPVVCLKEIVRQEEKSIIVSNARKIIEGNIIDGKKSGVRIKKNEFEFIEIDGESIKEKVLGVIDKLLKSGTSIYNIQVMSPLRKGINGIEELNREIADRFNYIPERDIYKFAVVDPIMVGNNNYAKQIYNGQRGLITRVNNDIINGTELITADFFGREVIFNKNEIEGIELSYASTFHKMQGSEIPVAILVVDKAHEMMLNRELLYVGITRGVKRVILIGSKEAFNKCVKRVIRERNSLLAERLVGMSS
ncbi:ATP-dependent RecD-like DNA helicase [Clostridium sp. JS66]|uniref:ATP-dependent DNA helicase n=1 Tax=Clostridium sp. JS66 TaxID=3064705 RepID=UPI00298E4489|nr:ATP-dependent RecD-like DNA helicase [Clostridium sp. JS66]WPC42805.1 ATP-dependent RecD-like DNA helicase [Clostridium sp. JS66]